VLEPLSGYLWLAARLSRADDAGEAARLSSAFNFGPDLTSNRTVAELVVELLKHWPGEWDDRSDPNAVHEAQLLNLATDKAFHLLGWAPVWSFEETIEQTARWYQHAQSADRLTAVELRRFTADQIAEYQSRASKNKLPWTYA
jgi:CDP-glucose 4,6-dehydratase